MSLSKQKKLLPIGLKRRKKREKRRLKRCCLVARKWMVCNFLIKSPDSLYSSVDGNFELWVLLGSFVRNVWNFSFHTFAKALCWIKITYLSATKYNVIFFRFFSSSSIVGENIAEITSVATEENESIFHGEINQPRGIQSPQAKGSSFQENWFDLYNWLHYDEEKDAAFCHVCMQAMESEILVIPSKDVFITKEVRSWKKALYIEKNKPGVFEKHSQSDSHKSAVERQKTPLSKTYGKIPKMVSKSLPQMNRKRTKKYY